MPATQSDGTSSAGEPQPRKDAAPSTSHATLRYTSMRFTVFLGCFLVLWLLALAHVIPVAGSMGAVFLLLIAAVISAPISYVLLSKQRDAMSAQIVSVVQRRRLSSGRVRLRDRIATQNAEEDAVDDAQRAAVAPHPQQ
jgi:hypothetical protein